LNTQFGIKRIIVEGLHEQFDVDLTLKPGLNIIYGKNGRGKTTVLHILANALELDFKRFEYLSFRQITIETYSGTRLDIVKAPGEQLRVLIDGAMTSLVSDSSSLSEAEVTSIRQALGPRPTYLPAFRSVLERIRAEYSPYQREAREGQAEEMEQAELASLREIVKGDRDPRFLREEASITVRKTLQCRQWFGPFVPIIRYPSMMEVDDGLSQEWRVAQILMSQREQNMFADVFVKVFRTIVGLDLSKESVDTETLLSSIGESLNSKDYQLGDRGSPQIYDQLKEATTFLQKKPGSSEGVENAVLQLYLETLVARKEERKTAFQGIRDFESSINKFLDKKLLKIGDGALKARARTAVTVGREGERAYGLAALSSGEKQILTMLYSASRSRFRSGIFLIDEPELSLHIDWQRDILRELMAQAPDRQIIACTHSPEVGADHLQETQDFEPRATQRLQDELFDDEGAEE
jgi:ABC-type lipoprotein export system ATPase subunit